MADVDPAEITRRYGLSQPAQPASWQVWRRPGDSLSAWEKVGPEHPTGTDALLFVRDCELRGGTPFGVRYAVMPAGQFPAGQFGQSF